MLSAAHATVSEQPETDTTGVALGAVEVVASGSSLHKLRGRAENVEVITSRELLKAACCNLGESFATNPSVDVNYSDAATGARQIKLLGLSGAYVQTLTENIPNLRGAGLPFGLGYVAGPWIRSIQISKGASSVKNGYESITGQVNVEIWKPQADTELAFNIYSNSSTQSDVNAMGNIHVSSHWSTAMLVHAENMFRKHDGNRDSFIDMPAVRQLTAMNRWARMGTHYVFQAGVKGLYEQRRSGQIGGHKHIADGVPPYEIDVATRRWELFSKHAYIFDRDNDGNVAAILSATVHDQDSRYGARVYDVEQLTAYASLMFERKWSAVHALSVGYNMNLDRYFQKGDVNRINHDRPLSIERDRRTEVVNGIYGQYTFSPGNGLVAMCGLRYDHNSAYGSAVTPRIHLRWNRSEALSVHGSVGKGYHSPHVLAENSYLLASGRRIIVEGDLNLEEAWNAGAGVTSTLYVGDRPLTLSLEYYYTHFAHQTIVDLDTRPDAVVFRDSDGATTHSHSLQAEATWNAFRDFTATAAYRLTDVVVDYGRGPQQKPLTPRYRGLVTASYAPMMALWQFDITCALTGPGRMPSSPVNADGSTRWRERYGAFATLNAQITRSFRHIAVYMGGENLTGYRQRNPIVNAATPYEPGFDATMVYGPLHGALFYLGIRLNWIKF